MCNADMGNSNVACIRTEVRLAIRMANVIKKEVQRIALQMEIILGARR